MYHEENKANKLIFSICSRALQGPWESSNSRLDIQINTTLPGKHIIHSTVLHSRNPSAGTRNNWLWWSTLMRPSGSDIADLSVHHTERLTSIKAPVFHLQPSAVPYRQSGLLYCWMHISNTCFTTFDSRCVRACVRERQKRRTVRVNRPLTIIPDTLTRVVRVHMTAKADPWARNTEHFLPFLPRPGCFPVGVELRLSLAACRAVDPRPDYSSMGENTHKPGLMNDYPGYMSDRKHKCVRKLKMRRRTLQAPVRMDGWMDGGYWASRWIGWWRWPPLQKMTSPDLLQPASHLLVMLGKKLKSEKSTAAPRGWNVKNILKYQQPTIY